MRKWGFGRKDNEPIEERFILSIDGGGVRGIVPATILSVFSDILAETGDDKPLYSHFDLIAGTSTGGLIALGLSAPEVDIEQDEGEDSPVYTSVKKGILKRKKQDILQGYIERAADPACLPDLYLNHAGNIFSPRNRIFKSVFSDKYDTGELEKFLSDTFKDHTIGEALVPTMVVSYDTIAGKAVIISSYSEEFRNLKCIEAARATSAAPLYFAPKFLSDSNGRRMALIDGGVIANNPSLLAYVEARKLYPNAKLFHILSLSTASPVYSYDPSSSSGGVSGWVEPIAHIYPNAQGNLIETTLGAMPDVDYTRIHGKVTDEKIKLDDTRIESLATLKAGAERLAESQRAELEAFAKKLSERKRWDNVKLRSAYQQLPPPSSEEDTLS